MNGYVDIQIGDSAISGRNQIMADLKNYLRDRIISTDAKGVTDLFLSTQEVSSATTGKDGIVIIKDGLPLVGVTEHIVISDVYKRMWRGFFSFGDQMDIQEIQLGHSLKTPGNTSSNWFDTTYAKKTYSVPITVMAGQPVSIVWTISIKR